MQIDTHTFTRPDGSQTTAIERASFQADDGVTFSAAVDDAGYVLLSVDDPIDEVDDSLRLMASDLDQLAALLQRLRAVSMGQAKAGA